MAFKRTDMVLVFFITIRNVSFFLGFHRATDVIYADIFLYLIFAIKLCLSSSFSLHLYQYILSFSRILGRPKTKLWSLFERPSEISVLNSGSSETASCVQRPRTSHENCAPNQSVLSNHQVFARN
jgi:hypothetical protein